MKWTVLFGLGYALTVGAAVPEWPVLKTYEGRMRTPLRSCSGGVECAQGLCSAA